MAQNFFINLDTIRGIDRYALSKFLEFSDNFDPITSDFLQSLSALDLGGLYTIRGEDARPDVISDEIYGSTQYWWIIMFYNGVTRGDYLVNGMELKYPKIGDLEDLYFTLKSKELGR
jgi:hypothetical protein